MSFRLRFWGTRGSIPTPGSATVRYGGNTPSIEVRTPSGSLVVLDAGTGIRELGRALIARANGSPITGDIFLTHAHWDHIQGIPFFAPAFQRGNPKRNASPVRAAAQTMNPSSTAPATSTPYATACAALGKNSTAARAADCACPSAVPARWR